jgi:hypothetical protein
LGKYGNENILKIEKTVKQELLLKVAGTIYKGDEVFSFPMNKLYSACKNPLLSIVNYYITVT